MSPSQVLSFALFYFLGVFQWLPAFLLGIVSDKEQLLINDSTQFVQVWQQVWQQVF